MSLKVASTRLSIEIATKMRNTIPVAPKVPLRVF
jgi:hypothetical protein